MYRSGIESQLGRLSYIVYFGLDLKMPILFGIITERTKAMIESIDKLNRDLNKIGEKLFQSVQKMPAGVTKELAIGVNDIRNTIIVSMQNTPQTGRAYRRGKKIHIASSPGNPPAIDFGELVRSIMYDVRSMEIEVGSEAGAPYAEYLEGGTTRTKITSTSDLLYSTQIGNIEPRPFVKPAVLKHHEEILDNVGKTAFEIIGDAFK